MTTTAASPEASTYQAMPALDDGTRAALRASIERHGVLVPVVVDDCGTIIDGHHRVEIARELKVRFRVVVLIPAVGVVNPRFDPSDLRSKIARRFPEVVVPRPVDPLRPNADQDWDHRDGAVTYLRLPEGADPVEVARTLNVDRRHLSVDQRRSMVADLRQQGHSLRGIAGVVGVSEGQVRKDIAAEELRTGTQLTPDNVVGIDGKSRSAKAGRVYRTDADHIIRFANDLVPVMNNHARLDWSTVPDDVRAKVAGRLREVFDAASNLLEAVEAAPDQSESR